MQTIVAKVQLPPSIEMVGFNCERGRLTALSIEGAIKCYKTHSTPLFVPLIKFWATVLRLQDRINCEAQLKAPPWTDRLDTIRHVLHVVENIFQRFISIVHSRVTELHTRSTI